MIQLQPLTAAPRHRDGRGIDPDPASVPRVGRDERRRWLLLPAAITLALAAYAEDLRARMFSDPRGSLYKGVSRQMEAAIRQYTATLHNSLGAECFARMEAGRRSVMEAVRTPCEQFRLAALSLLRRGLPGGAGAELSSYAGVVVFLADVASTASHECHVANVLADGLRPSLNPWREPAVIGAIRRGAARVAEIDTGSGTVECDPADPAVKALDAHRDNIMRRIAAAPL